MRRQYPDNIKQIEQDMWRAVTLCYDSIEIGMKKKKQWKTRRAKERETGRCQHYIDGMLQSGDENLKKMAQCCVTTGALQGVYRFTILASGREFK